MMPRMKSHTLVTPRWFSLRCLACRFFFFQSEFSKPPSSIQVSYFNLSSRRRGRPCLLIPHISAQDGECVAGMKKETFPSCLVPPTHLSFFSSSHSAQHPYGAASLSRRLSRLPRSLHRNHTGRGVWEVAVTQCMQRCLLTFISICHDPRPIKKNRGCGFGARFLFFFSGGELKNTCTLLFHAYNRNQIRSYLRRHNSFTFPIR